MVLFEFYFISHEKHVRKHKKQMGHRHFGSSHMGLFCLHMSHRKDVRLILLKLHMQKIAKIGNLRLRSKYR